MAGKKTGKRLLTWVLVLVMALSLLPLNALAAEADEAAALQMSDEDNSEDRSLMPAKTTYTITFDASGGKLNNGNETFDATYNSKKALVKSGDVANSNILDENPSNPPYVFQGWFYKQFNIGIKKEFKPQSTKVNDVVGALSHHGTIYAKWSLPNGFEKASIFYLKDPTRNLDSNTGEDWRGPLGGTTAGFVDTTGFIWKQSATNASVKNSMSVQPDDVTWPSGYGTPNKDGLKLDKHTDEWNDIFEAFKTKVEADNGVGSLTEDQVDSITLVPYNVSRGNQTYGNYHVDCDVVIKCNFITVDFMVKNDSNVFASILNGRKITCPKGEAFPENKVPTAPEKVGYEFDDWFTNEACTTKADFTTALTTDTTFYGKYTEKETPAPEPADPKVGDNFDFDKNIVDVFCETTSDHDYSYGLMNDYYTVSDRKQLQNGNWQCEITINLDKYFALYNSEHPGHTRDKEHKEATSIMRIYPTWYASRGKWIFVGTGTAKIFVKCDAVTPPTEPSKEDIKELLGSNAVQIICTNGESGHGSKTFGLIDGTFSIVHSGYNCEVKIDSFNEYVEKFNTELDVAQGTHISDTSKTSKGQIIINLKWEDGAWTEVNAPAKHYVLCVTPKYTVTYTDGAANGASFTEQKHENLLSGEATPAWVGTADKPVWEDHFFAGWEPEVAPTVTGNATYVAQWKDDKNNNGTPDDEEEKYTVTYTDGAANGASFTEQKHENLLSGEATPAWVGTADKPVWEDHFFAGWEPEVAPTVTGNATYVAQWKDDKNNNGTPDDEEEKYTVTYTDGAANGASFTEQKHENLLSGEATPAWVGTADKPVWEDHVFAGWEPEVAEKVTENATYAAQWKEDKNNNGIPDENEDKYTVTYTDGVNNEEVFADQVYGNLLSGTATPAFNGTPTRNGYRFAGWNPAVADNVTESVTYAAQWTPRTDLSYTVHYYLKNTTKQVADDKTVNGQTFNADVTEKAIRISGYRVYGDSVKSITIGTGTNEIIFYYTRASRPSASSTSKPTLNTGDHYAYVMGYPDGTVRPNGSITRAEVSAILFRLLSDKTRDEYFTTESSFTDVKAGAWYNNSIATLEKAGVIVDTAKGGAFRPNEAITRAELAAMLAQFSDAKPVKGVKFSDVSAEHWAYEAIAIAAKMGWIEGYPDGTFRPDATITRAEMMTLVNRALERVPSDEDHLLSKRVMLTFPDCKSGDWFYIAVQEATNSHTYERAATEKNGDEQWTALRANRDWTQLEK